MTKARFSGFPIGSIVVITTLKDGVAKGPITQNTWKQVAAGNITFEIYSLHGAGQAADNNNRGNRVSTFVKDMAFEVADSDLNYDENDLMKHVQAACDAADLSFEDSGPEGGPLICDGVTYAGGIWEHWTINL